MTKRTVKLEEIKIDGGTQFRKAIKQEKVIEYAERMEDDDEFPPVSVIFDGSSYWLWDGFHRYHACQKAGFITIEVDYKPGTQEDAQDLALGANGTHGLELSNEDKRFKVEQALSMERHKDKNNREIARLCHVSDKFVAAVKDPKAKERQAKNVQRHFEAKAQKEQDAIKSQETETDPKPSMLDGNEPSDEELKANEMAMQADMDAMNKLLESDDALATAHEEIKRLNFLLAQKEIRIAAIMREKSECIKLCKKLQTQVDKINKAKK